MAALGGGDIEVTAGQMQGLVNNAFLPFNHYHLHLNKRFWAHQLLGGIFFLLSPKVKQSIMSWPVVSLIL